VPLSRGRGDETSAVKAVPDCFDRFLLQRRGAGGGRSAWRSSARYRYHQPQTPKSWRRYARSRTPAKGEAEIGMQQINVILPVAGADYVGPLQAELQGYVDFAVSVLKFGFADAVFKMGDQRAISAFTKRSNAAGLRSFLAGIEAPRSARRFATAGSSRALSSVCGCCHAQCARAEERGFPNHDSERFWTVSTRA
jgi:hypothetical protein